jgi:diguanylate cyclase (GGDEF)-like protein/PAS domain S-box-containing protein
MSHTTEGAAVGFWLAPSGKIATWNAACTALLGYEAQDILARPVGRLLPPGAAAQLAALLDAARLAPATVQTELVHASGTILPVTLTMTPQCRKAGRLCGFGALVLPGAKQSPPAPPLTEHDLLASTALGAIMDLLPGTFYLINPAGRLVLWNSGVEKATGLAYAAVATTPATDMFPAAERALVQARIEEVLREGGPVVLEASLLSRDGTTTPFLFTGTRFVANGTPYVCGMGLDISARRQQEAQLRLRERALHASSNGIFIARSGGNSHAIEYVNPAFERITGYRAADTVGINWEIMCGQMSIPGLDDEQQAQVRAAIRERRETRVVCRYLRKNGEIFWNEMTVAPVVDELAANAHFIGVMNDVTEAQQRTSYLEHEVNHDILTGLANRNLLWDRLEQAIHMAQRGKALVAVILVDLDNFKIINDTLGHEAGDEVLRVVARKMSGAVRDSDTVARLGGDEFVLVLVNQPSLRYTLRMIERLRKGMENAVSIDGREVPIQASMGVSVFPHDGATAGELMRAADTAMYHAKLSGRNDVQFFSNDMKVATDAKQKLELNMRHALDNHEMFLLFQPKLSLATGKIVGAEALLRWQHPEQGVLLPASFIAEAEENGAIVLFGEWVFARVCESMRHLKDIGFGQLVMSMNVSFREFSQHGFIGLLGDKLRAWALAPDTFELEISEANLLRNADLSRRIFSDIARLGIKLTVDEFGAGVSSLKNLHELPVTNLKIFKSYVNRLNTDNVSDMMAKTIIGIGHLMNMGVIGEGVETPGQRDFLKQHGCDQAQGNYFSQPVTLPAFERLLTEASSEEG